MSTFNGRVREYPTISVDNFATPRQAYFLSHCHIDHLVGLSRNDFNGPIYCSEVTARALVTKSVGQPAKKPYAHLRKVLRVLPLGKSAPVDLGVGGGNVQVTMLNAFHCPGSVMFLFEGSGGRVLYTGDTRVERLHVASFSLADVDHLYLDTTLLKPAFMRLPARQQSLIAFARAAVYARRLQPRCHIVIVSTSLGFESVWRAVGKALGCKVFVPRSVFRFFEKLWDDCAEVLTADPKESFVHACGGCDVCAKEVTAGRAYRFIAGVRSWEDLLSRSDYRDFKNADEALPGIVRLVGRDVYVLFSMHASVEELRQLVAVVNPREITHCVVDLGTSTLKLR